MKDKMSLEAEVLYSSGVQKYFNKNFMGAVADLTEVIDLQPDHSDAKSYRELAILRLRNKGNELGRSDNQ